MKVSALVVVYNLDISVLMENIETYIDFVDHLFVLDNSDKKSLRSQGGIYNQKITLIDFHENYGIAYALNQGCRAAIEKGYSWILTFDQDSRITTDYVKVMIAFLNENKSLIQHVGILAPKIDLQIEKVKESNRPDVVEIADAVMTSGCLVNLNAFFHVEGFCDELFIDWVDNDFCYRLKLSGYKIIQLNNCVLRHQLGDSIEYRLFNRHLFYATNHNYVRYYYKTRNAIYLYKIYRHTLPGISFRLLKSIVFDFLKILLVEEDKIRKLQSMKKGVIDCRKNRMFRIDSYKE